MAAIDSKTSEPLIRMPQLSLVRRLLVRISILLLKTYQLFISPLLGPRCRFYPSCSHYAIEAIDQHGFVRGCALSAKRIAKCHPGHPGGIDEVPVVTSKTVKSKLAKPISANIAAANPIQVSDPS